MILKIAAIMTALTVQTNALDIHESVNKLAKTYTKKTTSKVVILSIKTLGYTTIATAVIAGGLVILKTFDPNHISQEKFFILNAVYAILGIVLYTYGTYVHYKTNWQFTGTVIQSSSYCFIATSVLMTIFIIKKQLDAK